MATPELTIASKVSEACEAGESFLELFYKTIDKQRLVVAGFYSDTSFLIWNGHTKSGVSDISAFYQSLPTSEHVVVSFDCQPVTVEQAVLVVCDGQVTYNDQKTENFSQRFLLSKMGEVWKIASDCFRFVDHL